MKEYRLVGWIRLQDGDCLGIPLFTDGSNIEFVPETDNRLHIVAFHPCYLEGGYTIDRHLPDGTNDIVYVIGQHVPIPFALGSRTVIANSADQSGYFLTQQKESRNSLVVIAVAEVLRRAESGVYEYQSFQRRNFNFSQSASKLSSSKEKIGSALTNIFNDAFELRREGESAVDRGDFVGGALAYISALDILGASILFQNNFDDERIKECLKNGRGTDEPLKIHQIRYFAAVGALMVFSLKGGKASGKRYRGLNFKNLRVEGKDIIRDGRPYRQWGMSGIDELTRSWLAAVDRQPMPIPMLLTSESEKVRTLQSISFHLWRESGVGFTDNVRRGILYRDNNFQFETVSSNGNLARSTFPNCESWCGRLSFVLNYLGQVARVKKDPGLERDLEDMLVSCSELLIEDSYERG